MRSRQAPHTHGLFFVTVGAKGISIPSSVFFLFHFAPMVFRYLRKRRGNSAPHTFGKRALVLFVISVLFSLPAFAQSIVFPMTIWGTLRDGETDVAAGAKIEFLSDSGHVLGQLLTETDGVYGGGNVYDKNIALSEFNGKIHIRVTVGSKVYDITTEQIDDSRKAEECPSRDALTFVSRKCRYDINLALSVCTAGDWEYGTWGSCQNNMQTRTATKKRNCAGTAGPLQISRGCSSSSGSGSNSGGERSSGGTAIQNAYISESTEGDAEETNRKKFLFTDEEGEQTIPNTESGGGENSFADTKGHWAENYIRSLATKGVFTEKRLFRPDDEVNRAEFVKTALEAFDIPLTEGTPHFPDVPEDAWYAPYVHTAFMAGIIRGYPDGSFAPDQSVNRAEGLKILLITSGITEIQGNIPFADVPEDAWFAPYVGYAFEQGIVQGVSPTRFAPEEKLTRAQMAKIIFFLLESI